MAVFDIVDDDWALDVLHHPDEEIHRALHDAQKNRTLLLILKKFGELLAHFFISSFAKLLRHHNFRHEILSLGTIINYANLRISL